MRIHTETHGDSASYQRQTKFPTLMAVIALATLLTTVGCKKKTDGDDHGAAKPAAEGHTEGDGHDHGHGGHEEGGEGHADEVKLTADAVEHSTVAASASVPALISGSPNRTDAVA